MNFARTDRFTGPRKSSSLRENIDFRDPISVFAIRKFMNIPRPEWFLAVISGVFTLVCRKRYRINDKFGQSIIQKMVLLAAESQNGP